MNIYSINLVVDTKYTDIYDKVALNKFPIIIQCADMDSLKNKLTDDRALRFIKTNIKSQRVFESASWCIRCFNGVEVDEKNIHDITWSLTDLGIDLKF